MRHSTLGAGTEKMKPFLAIKFLFMTELNNIVLAVHIHNMHGKQVI